VKFGENTTADLSISWHQVLIAFYNPVITQSSKPAYWVHSTIPDTRRRFDIASSVELTTFASETLIAVACDDRSTCDDDRLKPVCGGAGGTNAGNWTIRQTDYRPDSSSHRPPIFCSTNPQQHCQPSVGSDVRPTTFLNELCIMNTFIRH
jgi:hypothetical protein